MRKKFFTIGALALTLAVAIGYGVKSSMDNDVQLSDLAKANIEALARVENPGGGPCTGGCRSIGWGFSQILRCDCRYTGIFSSCNAWGCV